MSAYRAAPGGGEAAAVRSGSRAAGSGRALATTAASACGRPTSVTLNVAFGATQPVTLSNLDFEDGIVDGTFSPPLCPAGAVHVFILDTGVSPTHVDLAPLLGSSYCALNATDCALHSPSWTDVEGHGTQCAGFAVGPVTGTFVGTGVVLHAVKVLRDNAGGTSTHVIQGMEWVERQVLAFGLTPAVVSLSLGGAGAATSLPSLAAAGLVAAGITVLAAAGNGNPGVDACNMSPANGAGVLSVGATDSSGNYAAFSNFGRCVTTWAPGVSVCSTYPPEVAGGALFANKSVCAQPCYYCNSGTSFSTPAAAGAAASLLAAAPCLSPAQVTSFLTAQSPGTGSTPYQATSVPVETPFAPSPVLSLARAAAALAAAGSPPCSFTSPSTPYLQVPVYSHYKHPLALAVDPAGGVIVADSGDGVVKRTEPGPAGVTRVIFPLSPGILPRNASLSGVAVDPVSGTVYVVDAANCALWSVAQGGSPQPSLVPTAPACPFGVAVSPSSGLFITDRKAGSAWAVGSGGGGGAAVTLLTAGTKMSNATALAVSSTGVLAVADNGNGRVLVFPAANATPAALAGRPGGPASGYTNPRGLAFDALGATLLVVDNVASTVYLGTTAAPSTPVTTLGSGFTSPVGVALDAAANVYVLDFTGDFDYGVRSATRLCERGRVCCSLRCARRRLGWLVATVVRFHPIGLPAGCV